MYSISRTSLQSKNEASNDLAELSLVSVAVDDVKVGVDAVDKAVVNVEVVDVAVEDVV